MRFPRVKADGQGFYHCVSRVVEGRFIFLTPPVMVHAHSGLKIRQNSRFGNRMTEWTIIETVH
jgi:hypothetical protein